ncbi:MAG: dihydrofolate reductase family protein [Chloroflexota bacterium]
MWPQSRIRSRVLTKVICQMSVSLDGFVTGPNPSDEKPFGDDGLRIVQWVFDLESWRGRQGLEGGERNVDAEILEEHFARTGSVILGRRMFDSGEIPWGDDPPFKAPVFVLTNNYRERIEKRGGTSFTFVTDGIESALRQAKEAAGDKDVAIAGGADTVQQFLRAGLLDELELHVVPVFVGDGRRLFEHHADSQVEMRCVRVVDSPGVTHLKYAFDR